MKKIENDYKIRVTPEESREVQEVCFECGVEWGLGGKTVQYTDDPYLYVHGGKGKITKDDEEEYFLAHKNQEVTPAEFIARYGGKRGIDNSTYVGFSSKEEWDVLVKVYENAGYHVKHKEYDDNFYSMSSVLGGMEAWGIDREPTVSFEEFMNTFKEAEGYDVPVPALSGMNVAKVIETMEDLRDNGGVSAPYTFSHALPGGGEGKKWDTFFFDWDRLWATGSEEPKNKASPIQLVGSKKVITINQFN